ncbi:hypothetical protein GW796_07830 [archaeon]|nr:hypothetical protein [archaeon]
MKESLNTIFIDLRNTFFSDRTNVFKDSKIKLLNDFNFNEHILNSHADPIAVQFINNLQELYEFNVVLLDLWITEEKHAKENFEYLFSINELNVSLHDNWHVNYLEYTSPLAAIHLWTKSNPQGNLTALISDEYKNQLDITKEYTVNYNHSIFVNKNNGLSLSNLKDISRSLNLWS